MNRRLPQRRRQRRPSNPGRSKLRAPGSIYQETKWFQTNLLVGTDTITDFNLDSLNELGDNRQVRFMRAQFKFDRITQETASTSPNAQNVFAQLGFTGATYAQGVGNYRTNNTARVLNSTKATILNLAAYSPEQRYILQANDVLNGIRLRLVHAPATAITLRYQVITTFQLMPLTLSAPIEVTAFDLDSSSSALPLCQPPNARTDTATDLLSNREATLPLTGTDSRAAQSALPMESRTLPRWPPCHLGPNY